MGSVQADASNEHKKVDMEDIAKKDHDIDDLPVLGGDPNLARQSSSTTSTSSDSSSDGDFFQLDELNKAESEHLASGININKSEGDGVIGHGLSTISSAPNLVDSDLAFSPTVDDRMLGVQVSPPVLDNNPFPDTNVGKGLLSPPAQTMVRTDVPDPNRIPSSVFARTKSTTPMEWSVASNESLFSIHVGNSSFSRDHMFLFGKSGELGNFFSPIDYSMPMAPPSASLVSPDVGRQLEQPETAQEANAEAMKEVLRVTAEAHVVKNKSEIEGASISRHSDGSGMSFRSFAFPILTGDKSGSAKTEHRLSKSKSKSSHKHQSLSPEETPTTPAPPAVPAPARNRWFSCFNCSFCC